MKSEREIRERYEKLLEQRTYLHRTMPDAPDYPWAYHINALSWVLEDTSPNVNQSNPESHKAGAGVVTLPEVSQSDE
jgi:hypothetical protein